MTLEAFLTDVARARGAFINGKHLAQVRVGDALVQDTVTNLFTNPSVESVVTPGGMVEVRRNHAVTTRPTAYAGSTWGAPANFGSVPEAGWLGGTLTATTTPYIFSATSARAYAVGERVTLSIRYRVTGANTGSAQHIAVIPHIRTGNAYYRGSHIVVRPMIVGQDEDVVVQWTTTVEIAAGQLDIAVVGSNAAGTGLATANAGFGLQATRALIEDGWTDGSFFDGAFSPDADLTPAWTGAAGASASILRGVSVAGWADSSAQTVTYQTADSPYEGARAARSVVKTTGAIGINPQTIAPVTGDTYTLIMHVRPKDRALQARARIRGTSGPVTTFPVGVWTEVRLVAAAGNGTDTQTGLLIAAASGHQIGDRIDTDLGTLVAGNYPGKAASGDSPGWAWDGPPHNSTSHGWR